MKTIIIYDPEKKEFTICHDGEVRIYEGDLMVYRVSQKLQDIVFNGDK